MIMNEALSLILLFMITTMVVLKYYRHLIIGMAVIIYLPMLVVLLLLGLLIKVLARYNQKLLNEGRYTIWLKRLTSLSVKYARLSEEVSNSFLLFVIGEDNMAIVIKRVGEEVNYVPKNQRDLPEAEQAVFIFKKISRRKLTDERDRTVGLSSSGRVDALRTASVGYRITVLGLHGWKNITDENGAQIPFDPANKEQMYELLPTEIQEELESEFGGGTGVKTESPDEDEDVVQA